MESLDCKAINQKLFNIMGTEEVEALLAEYPLL